jgi:DNA-binding transcriptional ArsR family regulator
MDENDEIDLLADVYRALADPNRLRILKLLRNMKHPLCVNGIANMIGVSQSAVSQQLRILRQQGLVSVKKEGYYKHYSLNDDRLDAILKLRESVLGVAFKV